MLTALSLLLALSFSVHAEVPKTRMVVWDGSKDDPKESLVLKKEPTKVALSNSSFSCETSMSEAEKDRLSLRIRCVSQKREVTIKSIGSCILRGDSITSIANKATFAQLNFAEAGLPDVTIWLGCGTKPLLAQ